MRSEAELRNEGNETDLWNEGKATPFAALRDATQPRFNRPYGAACIDCPFIPAINRWAIIRCPSGATTFISPCGPYFPPLAGPKSKSRAAAAIVA